ncbi:radical SAM protein [bacterium]|nr:radical SAM protein [bacterium]
MDASIIVTYRCPMRCVMCNIWQNQTKKEEEFRPQILEKLPKLNAINVTGGEPFERNDLDEIIAVLFEKSKRVVISTSGWYEDRIFDLAKKYPKLGFRVSIEGLSTINDELRGRLGGFDKGIRVLLGLRKMGIKDIGFGVTVSNNNSNDMLWLYELSKNLKMQFATAAFHNSFYFQKCDNVIKEIDKVSGDFEELADRLIKEKTMKSWFRSLFNVGLINYINDGKRMLPCEAGNENFFIDPKGEVLPCNGMENKYWYKSMGNLHDVDKFEEIWWSQNAKEVRQLVANCEKQCWMIGSASPVMQKYIKMLIPWIIKTKIYSMIGKRIQGNCCPSYTVQE